MSEKRYVNLFDAHVGFEKVTGKLKALHDPKMLAATMRFVADFKPDLINLCGDMLDCGGVSHWNEDEKRQTEDVRLLKDAETLQNDVLIPCRDSAASGAALTYLGGNHEDWLEQFVDKHPALEGVLSLDNLLQLTKNGWTLLPHGGVIKLGHLYLIHGHQIKGAQHIAKKAVDVYQRNVHFGHHHTHQVWTSIAPLDMQPKQGVAVPCLAQKNPGYANGQPNRWMQGFEYGWLESNGNFHNNIALLVGRKFFAEGRTYRA